jgi:uncharacterized membrane protein
MGVCLMKTVKNVLFIPAITFMMLLAILLNIAIFREVFVFLYLSFVPGYAILKNFKLKKIGLLNTILLSSGLSIASLMFIGLLVNYLYYILGMSQPLSPIPLTIAISAFTIFIFFIACKSDMALDYISPMVPSVKKSEFLLLAFIMVILPSLGIIGALYVNTHVMLLLCVVISMLCVMSVASSNSDFSRSFFPLLIFSVSIAIICLNLLMSKHIVGDDASLEYYIFNVTHKSGYLSQLDASTNSYTATTYSSMLSISLLPSIYSILTNIQGEILFKLLYCFILSLIPLILFKIYSHQTNELIGLLSTFFFVFTAYAFFGELITVNRQIVGELFLVLSILLLFDTAMSISKKRILIIIFGAGLIFSHYSITYLYLTLVVLIVIIASIKPNFDEVFNATTIVSLFGITFLWYAFNSISLIDLFVNKVRFAVSDLMVPMSKTAGSAGVIYGLPQVFTIASWINLVIAGIVNLFYAIGLIVVILSPKILKSHAYRFLLILAGIILFVTLIFPGIAATLNFTRFYAIILLFSSPCVVLGGKALLENMSNCWRKIKVLIMHKYYSENKEYPVVFLLIGVLLSAYFLSQSGFINYVTNGAIHSLTFDYARMKTSNSSDVVAQFYGYYFPDQDAISAVWLSKFKSNSSIVYADSNSRIYVLVSCAFMPWYLMRSLTNETKLEQNSFTYMSTLNVVKGILPTQTGLFNTSVISHFFAVNDLVYSNGNSEIWYLP